MYDDSRMNRLEPLLRRLSTVEGPAEVFKILLEAGRLAAPCGAVLLVRQGQLHGWGSIGYDTEIGQAVRRFRTTPDSGWLARLIGSPDTLVPRSIDEASPDFGQTPSAEASGCVVRVKGKPIAIVVLERRTDQETWNPEILAMAVTVAQLRLELDVWQRRVQAMQSGRQGATPNRPAAATTAAATAPPATTTTAAGPTTPAAPTPTPTPAPALQPPVTRVAVDSAPTAAASVAEPTDVEPVEQKTEPDDPDHDAARRYARLVATDIRLYNEESVVLGRKNGDLCKRISDHLGRGKETFLRRHGKLGPVGLELLHEAFVQVLAGGDAALIPRSTLD